MTRKGIDVSFAQGKIDWKAVKGSKKADFVIIRAGYGRESTQKDAQFENNYKGCKENGIPCGAYWYSYADSVEDAKREARACIETIKGKQFEYPIYFDLEEKFQFDRGGDFCDSIVKAFCDELEKAGYWAGLYCSTNYLNNIISPSVAGRYALWVAQYYDECTYNKATHGMWQYTSSSKVNGISGNVDADECYVDYPKLIKTKGLNGFEKEKPVLDADGYKKGSNTIGCLSLKEMLMIAKKLGINKYGMDENKEFGNGTQNAVNYMLGVWGYKQNGIAGENFIKKLAAEINKKIKV